MMMDDQLEGICKLIDGINMYRKDWIFYNVYISFFCGHLSIVMLAKKSMHKNPVMVLVFPTNGVKEEIASFTVVLALMGLDETVAIK
jgi:hypothetical protein